MSLDTYQLPPEPPVGTHQYTLTAVSTAVAAAGAQPPGRHLP